MNETRNKDKHKGIDKIIYKFKYSISGLIYFYKSEFSAIIFTICTLIVVTLGIIYNISTLDWVLLLVSLGAILYTEILNTSQEVIVDMFTKEHNELAKYAKDLGSGATFIASLIAFIVFLYIFIPRIFG